MRYHERPAVNICKKIGLLSLYAASRERRNFAIQLLVITYHRISDSSRPSDPLITSVDTFEKQILFLKEHYKLLSGLELFSSIQNGDRISPQSCLITFDDGWRDNYTHAFPILKEHKVPAIIFIATDYIGTNRIFWHERLKYVIERLSKIANQKEIDGYLKRWPSNVSTKLKKIIVGYPKIRTHLIQELIVLLKATYPDKLNELIDAIEENAGINSLQCSPTMLSWDEVKEMAERNVMFCSHTKTHALLTHISDSDVFNELEQSKKVIEDKLGKAVYFLSYPNGYYNDKIVCIAREIGYSAGFTCLPGKNEATTDPFQFKRKHLREDYSLGFNGKFSELFFKMDLSDIRHRIRRWRKDDAY
jgi:peptidoglycan/xylan/chitin deacetylase (PgdA/CDA1 family)